MLRPPALRHLLARPSLALPTFCRPTLAVMAVAGSLLAGCADGSHTPSRVPRATLDLVVSTADGSRRVDATSIDLRNAPSGAEPDITVALDRPRQRLRGVGASLTESSAKLLSDLPSAERHAALQTLFDPTAGGMSVLRLVIGSSDFSLDHQSLADTAGPPGAPLANFSIDRDRQWVIPVVREILRINPHLDIVASSWSAPGWMKDSGNYLYGFLTDEHEPHYAAYLVDVVRAYREAGIDIGWLSVQNEPAALQVSYPSMIMSPEQQERLVADDLGPALHTAGLDTEVLLWDHNWCDAQPPGACTSDAPATFPLQVLAALPTSDAIGGTAFHCYGGNHAAANDAVHEADPDREIWETECSGGAWQKDPFAELATLVITDRTHWSNATLLWNLALDPDHGPHLGGCTDCRGVITVDPATASWTSEQDRDVLATAARFVPAGSVALSTTTSATDVTASGTCAPDGRAAVLVWNAGGARTVTVRLGDSTFRVPVEERSLTAVRAPRSFRCDAGDDAGR